MRRVLRRRERVYLLQTASSLGDPPRLFLLRPLPHVRYLNRRLVRRQKTSSTRCTLYMHAVTYTYARSTHVLINTQFPNTQFLQLSSLLALV